jgi:hypothetical protein
MVEYMPCTHRVIGSIPIISILLQQSSLMVEHGNHTPGDVGSSPIFVNCYFNSLSISIFD